MKIENKFLNPVVPQNKLEGVQRSDKGNQSENLSTRSTTEISEQARLLFKARLDANEVPAERVERVQELKQRVENGNYAIPYSDLARQLVSVVKGMKD
jgi:flagellar biosynthesis anti-sigma factor FlgM